jgi:hypothetical protein
MAFVKFFVISLATSFLLDHCVVNGESKDEINFDFFPGAHLCTFCHAIIVRLKQQLKTDPDQFKTVSPSFSQILLPIPLILPQTVKFIQRGRKEDK